VSCFARIPAEPQQADGIIAAKLDRLARNTRDVLALVDDVLQPQRKALILLDSGLTQLAQAIACASCVSPVINGVQRLINGVQRLINGVQRLINGVRS